MLWNAYLRGRRYGMVLAILFFGGLAMLYLQAGPLSRAVPFAAPALTSYAASIDAGRVWLSGTWRTVTKDDGTP